MLSTSLAPPRSPPQESSSRLGSSQHSGKMKEDNATFQDLCASHPSDDLTSSAFDWMAVDAFCEAIGFTSCDSVMEEPSTYGTECPSSTLASELPSLPPSIFDAPLGSFTPQQAEPMPRSWSTIPQLSQADTLTSSPLHFARRSSWTPSTQTQRSTSNTPSPPPSDQSYPPALQSLLDYQRHQKKSKRQEQNRRAQQKYRERNITQTRTLEGRIAELEIVMKHLNEENDKLRDQMTRLGRVSVR